MESSQHDYLAEAVRLVPTDFRGWDLDLVRSYGLLALLGAHRGDNALLHKYLGLYHGICGLTNLHDESRWPADTTECDREVRRRLFWSMYRLEVHSACVLGNALYSSESQSNVEYPVGVHHESFLIGRNVHFENSFLGFDTTTDLYRVLEHVLADLRCKASTKQSRLGIRQDSKATVITEKLAELQKELTPQLSFASLRANDGKRHRCGYQAANVLCTIHFVRLISCAPNEIEVACQTAQDMVASMKGIPVEHIRSIGSLPVRQLAVVGHVLLGLASQPSVTIFEHHSIRAVVTAILGFLESVKEQDSTATTSHQRLASALAEVSERQRNGTAGTAAGIVPEIFLTMDHFHTVVDVGEHDGFPTQQLSTHNFQYFDPE